MLSSKLLGENATRSSDIIFHSSFDIFEIWFSACERIATDSLPLFGEQKFPQSALSKTVAQANGGLLYKAAVIKTAERSRGWLYRIQFVAKLVESQ